MKMSQVIAEAKRLGLKRVCSDEIEWTIEKFEAATSWFANEYNLYNDPAGARVDMVNDDGTEVHGSYYLKY